MTPNDTPYDESFFRHHHDVVYASARSFASLLLSELTIRSVIDVGCGNGTWLKAFADLGVANVKGIDGSYVDRQSLEVSPDAFVSCDLRRPREARGVVDGRFDLALSLEVAEHLPSSVADEFVETLTSYAPCVLFSAAIPYQGGTAHLNEQWPNYWAERFGAQGYVPVDWVRPILWGEREVAYWYVQNALLYVRSDHVQGLPESLKRSVMHADDPGLSRVHPRKWMETHDPETASGRAVLAAAARGARHVVRRRLRRRPQR